MVELLRAAGHEVYDFRHPNLGRGQENGFRWSDIDTEWQSWSPYQYRDALAHPIAVEGFGADKGGMDWADTCVLLNPSGRSAHSEAAYMQGQGKHVIVVLRPGEPELMYGLFDDLVVDTDELLAALARPLASREVEADARQCSECGEPWSEDAAVDPDGGYCRACEDAGRSYGSPIRKPVEADARLAELVKCAQRAYDWTHLLDIKDWDAKYGIEWRGVFPVESEVWEPLAAALRAMQSAPIAAPAESVDGGR